MTSTKIHLSKLETELIQNKEWLLTKQSIIDKVYHLFGEMHLVYKRIAENEKYPLHEFYQNASAKISKGENYKGLPYVILDYPASFSKEKIFAIRTMFWWGNFFSISLHLSGKNFQLKKDLAALKNFLQQKDFFICINKNEWQHHFDASNYITFDQLNDNGLQEILKKHFFKISKKMEINKWDEVPEFLEKSFIEILEFVQINFQAGEKVL